MCATTLNSSVAHTMPHACSCWLHVTTYGIYYTYVESVLWIFTGFAKCGENMHAPAFTGRHYICDMLCQHVVVPRLWVVCTWRSSYRHALRAYLAPGMLYVGTAAAAWCALIVDVGVSFFFFLICGGWTGGRIGSRPRRSSFDPLIYLSRSFDQSLLVRSSYDIYKHIPLVRLLIRWYILLP